MFGRNGWRNEQPICEADLLFGRIVKMKEENMHGNTTVKLAKLEWDSCFFGFPVWKLTADMSDSSTIDVVGRLKEFSKINDGGTCYVFLSKAMHDALHCKLTEMGAVYFGSRVEFCADIEAIEETDAVCDVVPIHEITDEVRVLAVGSGKKSRFSKDYRFASMCRDMYLRWIENCFEASKNGSGEVLGIYDDEGGLSGLIAVTATGETAKIELLSVSGVHRRQGIGKRLVRYAFSFARARECREIVVITQGDNLAGCRLYESSGFKECKRSEVWHLTV